MVSKSMTEFPNSPLAHYALSECWQKPEDTPRWGASFNNKKTEYTVDIHNHLLALIHLAPQYMLTRTAILLFCCITSKHSSTELRDTINSMSCARVDMPLLPLTIPHPQTFTATRRVKGRLRQCKYQNRVGRNRRLQTMNYERGEGAKLGVDFSVLSIFDRFVPNP